MRIGDWSSDVCSSDLHELGKGGGPVARTADRGRIGRHQPLEGIAEPLPGGGNAAERLLLQQGADAAVLRFAQAGLEEPRSEEHTSELQSLMRISYAVFCLKKNKKNNSKDHHTK